jgi:anti-sigma regulatory factor (Ser/Thr protein kinase)
MEMIIPWILSYIPESIIKKIGQNKIELAFEELIVNIYEHAYKKDPKPICLVLKKHSEGVLVEIRDFGPKFNLIDHQTQQNRKATLDNSAIGGQGLKLVKAVLSDIKHSYSENMNCVSCNIS